MSEDKINYKQYQILVVDNDPQYRKVAADRLKNFGFNVLTADSVTASKEIIKSKKVDLVLSELRMPQESGVELVKWIRRVYDTSFRQNLPLPFLIMTGFSHLLQQEDLEEYFVNGCLIKPLESDELHNAILIALNLKVEEENEPTPDQIDENGEISTLELKQKEFCRILLSDFTSLPILQMDLYIQLSKDKFVRIAYKGDKVNDIQFKRYREKGIEFLYIRKDDFKKVVDFNLKLNRAVSQSEDLDLEKKKRFMAKTGEIVLENAFVNGINQETFEEAKDYLLSSVNTLIDNKETFNLLEILNDHSDSLYAHSLGVSLYSVMIAQQMGWRSGSNLFKLSFGALMHDIGKKDFDPELIAKPKSDITMSEKVLLETHPERGKEILEGLRSIPSEVIAIVYEHHENSLGQGYPRLLKKNRITPMARIVSVADEFCYFAIKNPDFPGADANKALQIVEQYKGKHLDHDALTALRRVVKEQVKKSA